MCQIYCAKFINSNFFIFSNHLIKQIKPLIRNLSLFIGIFYICLHDWSQNVCEQFLNPNHVCMFIIAVIRECVGMPYNSKPKNTQWLWCELQALKGYCMLACCNNAFYLEIGVVKRFG